MTAVRALAFGDLEGSCWGAAWVPDGAEPILALGAGSAVEARPASLTAGPTTGEWRLEAGDAQLIVAPLAKLASTDQPEPAGGSDELCRVSGRLGSGDQGHDLDLLGWRAQNTLPLGEDRLGSLRLLSAWFEPDEGMSLLALRPDGARGQDGDVISAAVLEPRLTPPISDPRLSTTYDAEGRPTRAGIELWISAETASEDVEPAVEHHYPRRLAGEALGARVDWSIDRLALHAALFRWHYRDQDGTGVYLLGVRR